MPAPVDELILAWSPCENMSLGNMWECVGINNLELEKGGELCSWEDKGRGAAEAYFRNLEEELP